MKKRMKRDVKWQTTHCIRCNKPALVWGGAVQSGREWVLAGWCRRCLRSYSHWYHGDYTPRMGRESVP